MKEKNLRKTKKGNATNTVKKMLVKTLTGVMVLTSLSSLNVNAIDVNSVREQANAAFSESDYETAYSLYEQIVEEGLGTANEYWNMGRIDINQGRYFNAVQNFENSLKFFEGNTFNYEYMYYCMGYSMYYEGLYHEVEQIYNQAMAKNAASIDLKWYYAQSLRISGQYEKALSVYSELFEEYDMKYSDNRGRTLCRMGDCYRALGRYQEANDYYENSLIYLPKDSNYCDGMYYLHVDCQNMDIASFVAQYLSEFSNYEIAEMLNGWGEYEEAIPYYESSRGETEEDVDLRIAYCYLYMGNVNKAVEIFEQLSAANPEKTDYLNALGSVYCDYLGDYDKALEYFDEALALNPAANGIAANRGIAYRKSGNYEAEAEVFADLYEQYPQYDYFIRNYLSCDVDLTPEKAIEAYSTYSDWPDNEQLQAVLLSKYVNNTSYSVSSMESFLQYYEEHNPDGSIYTLSMAQAKILIELGRYNEALDILNAWVNNTEIHTYSVHKMMADCYQKMGDYDNALFYQELSYEHTDEESVVSWKFDNAMLKGDTEAAKMYLDNYCSENGSEEDIAGLYMIWAGYMKDYDMLKKYSEMVLQSSPTSVKAKAYNAVALRELGYQSEYEAMVADIDSITYSKTNVNKMLADCILGRTGDAKDTYRELVEHVPGSARTYRNDYELSILFYDPEFCALADREVIIVTPKFDLPGEN